MFVLFLSSKCVIVNGGFIMEKDVNTSSISSLAKVRLLMSHMSSCQLLLCSKGLQLKGCAVNFHRRRRDNFPQGCWSVDCWSGAGAVINKGDMERCNSRVAKCLPQGFWMWKAARNSWSYYFFLDDMRCNTVTLCRLEGVVFLEAVTFKHTTRVEKRVEHFNLLSGGGRQKTSTVPCRAYNMRQR